MTSVSPWSTQGGQRNPLTRDRRQDFDQRRESVDTIVRLKTEFIHLHPECPEHGQGCDEIAFLAGLGHSPGRHPLSALTVTPRSRSKAAASALSFFSSGGT